MNDYKVIIREWASEIRVIQRVWIFGSRASGDHRPDSDLEVQGQSSSDDCSAEVRIDMVTAIR